MTNRGVRSPVLVFLLVMGPLVGCSRQEAAPADSTAPTPAAQGASAPPVPAAGAQTPPAPQSWAEAMNLAGASELAADYERQCASEENASDDCEILRSLLVAEVVTALEMTERSRDQRGTEEALAALDLADEPDIVVAAGRILGKFPDTPGVAAKVLPLLLKSRYVEVQRIAAELLKAGPDAGLGEVAGIWLQNHSASADTNYDEYPDFPAHYTSLGFPKYSGAEWFSPADSDRSVGWSTTDSVATVTRWFSDQMRAPALGVEQWIAERNVALKQLFDQSKMARMQQLVEKVVKGDEAARAELEKLQKEFENQQRNAERASQQAIGDILPPSAAMAEARWIVAQRKDGRISRVVLVYPLKGLQRTVIQLAWDLSDYPSAWPTNR